MRRLFPVLFFACWACTDTPTQPDGGFADPTSIEGAYAQETDSFIGPAVGPNTETPRQAEGKLHIAGAWARCEQTTDYPIDLLSVHRIYPERDRAQNRVGLFDGPEGSDLTPWCGVPLQLDCTVRDEDPRAGQISAYDLYDHALPVVVDCPPPGKPKCKSHEPEIVDEYTNWENWGECFEGERTRKGRAYVVYSDGCIKWRSEDIIYESEECEAPQCELDFRSRKARCESAGGTYTFNTEKCSDNCDIPPPPSECRLPSVGTTATPPNSSPSAECAAFGDYVPGDPGFTICKAGTDWEVVGNGYDKDQCPNGKDVSHLTTCACPDED